MTIDDRYLADLASRVAGLFDRLDDVKHKTPPPGGVPVRGGGSDSRPPGAWGAIAAGVDAERRLHDALRGVGAHVDTGEGIPYEGGPLCRWVAMKARPVLASPLGLRVVQALEDVAEGLAAVDGVGISRVGGVPAVSVEAVRGLWGTAAELSRLVGVVLGVEVPAARIRSFARASRFQRRLREDGVREYVLGEVLDEVRLQLQ